MALINTANLLPTIHQTDANVKFLNATLDQLIAEPEVTRLYGYVGRTFAPTYQSTDNYVTETTALRQNYQLEPGLIFKNAAGETISARSYTDLLQKINIEGGIVDNHSRLFNNENYSFDGLVDFDKLVNFNQYYWLPNGPESVRVFSNLVSTNQTFTMIHDAPTSSFKSTDFLLVNNPEITLARGGEYHFIVNQSGSKFCIQSSPDISGNWNSGINSRQVYGVTNNAISSGSVKFSVPTVDAQSFYTKMPLIQTVDFVINEWFTNIQNRTLTELSTNFGGFDGINFRLDGKFVVFAHGNLSDAAWEEFSSDFLTSFNVTPPDSGSYVDVSHRAGIWKINVIRNETNDEIIKKGVSPRFYSSVLFANITNEIDSAASCGRIRD